MDKSKSGKSKMDKTTSSKSNSDKSKSDKSNSDNTRLENFSKEHFTFINQVFGDQTVREVIAQVFPNEKYRFEIEEYETSHHHVLYDIKKRKTVCSFKSKVQNMNLDINDTLCQSYSLLTFFNLKIDEDRVNRQMDMINMYETILKSKDFRKTLEETIDIPNRAWSDYRTEGNPPLTLQKSSFYSAIKRTLNHWREYGYHFFIGQGTM
jgi:hypothetical protein